MDVPGIITLDGHPIGSFEIDGQDRVTMKFNKGAAGVQETLEYAADQGMTLGLILSPEVDEDGEFPTARIDREKPLSEYSGFATGKGDGNTQTH